MNQSVIGLTALMFIAGVGIPIMAAMNAGLGTRIGSPIGAVFILSSVAAVLSCGFMTVTDWPDMRAALSAPKIYYAGGFLFFLYIFSVTIAAPKIGLGNAIFFVLLGQLIAAAIIDHFGILSVPLVHITPRRGFGILLMTLGVFLARKEVIPVGFMTG